MADVLSQLGDVIRDVFVAPDAEIRRETTTIDIPGWDSIGHARLVLSIEVTFSISFEPSETQRLKNVGELVDLIEAKTSRST